jgi:hypothetical protein
VYNLNYKQNLWGVQSWIEITSEGVGTKKVEYHCNRILGRHGPCGHDHDDDDHDGIVHSDVELDILLGSENYTIALLAAVLNGR